MLSHCCFCSGKFQSPRTEHLSIPPFFVHCLLKPPVCFPVFFCSFCFISLLLSLCFVAVYLNTESLKEIFLICDKTLLICANAFLKNQPFSRDSNKYWHTMTLLYFQQWATGIYFVIVSNCRLIWRVGLFLICDSLRKLCSCN